MASSKGTLDSFIIRSKRPRSEIQLNQTVEASSAETVPNQNETSVNSSIQEDIPIISPMISSGHIISDPGVRPPMSSIGFNSAEREKIRRAYLNKGPCQPKLTRFPITFFSGKPRKFNPEWYKDFGAWLEYSERKDAVYCLCCYLFNIEYGDHKFNHDSFIGEGFRNWKKKDRLRTHVGDQTSSHNKCLKACEDLLNQKQHVDIMIAGISTQAKLDYRIRLNATIECVRMLLMQALAFRGHDESEHSKNQGNFLELLKFLCKHNEEVDRVSLRNAPENNKLTSPIIQKDICNVASFLTTRAIVEDIGDKFFSLLVDEARDSAIKEQMIVCLRYINTQGCIVERILGIVHVQETSSRVLKSAIESLFATHGLSLSRIRGQDYDGASNMSGNVGGLKSLILEDNQSAYYVHCFAHQLQLTLVAVAKKNDKLSSFFDYLVSLTNFIGASCKRKDLLRVKQLDKVVEGISQGTLDTGRGMNQEVTLKRPGEIRWSSHYNTIISVISLFSSTLDVLEEMKRLPSFSNHKGEISRLIEVMCEFEFVFLFFLMKKVLGITNDLSQALQRKDQDLPNAMGLVKVAKIRLHQLREDGWDNMLVEVCEFCEKNEIDILNMDEAYVPRGRSQRKVHKVTNHHHFKTQLLVAVVDFQLKEMNERFDNVNMELLTCISCLDPRHSFLAFDKQKLIQLAKFYPFEFDGTHLLALEDQLENYIVDMRSNDNFQDLKGVGELAQRMVQKQKDIGFPLVYMLVRLALTLPVATATVERGFSAMNLIKNVLRNTMGDTWLNDCLVTYVERDVFEKIENEAIMQRFQEIKNRRMLL